MATPRETVNKGLQDRKDVRAAEAARDMYRDRAYDINNARIRDRVNQATAIRRLELERDTMRKGWEDAVVETKRLNAELAACRKREANRHQKARLVNAAKAVTTCLLLTFARDLGLMEPWLVNALLVISVAYVAYAVARLIRDERKK